MRRASFSSALHAIRRGFERGSQGIRSLRGSLSFQSLHYQSSKKSNHQEKILDPQDQFLQRWNKIFLISCVFALAWDPLFFYIPVIDRNKKCLKFDATLKIIACVLRTITDLFYLLHIFIQFRTGFISPSSRVIGRGELIKDHATIAKRYIFSYFFVDVLAVLPLPQVAVLFIIPRLHGPVTSKGLLKAVVFSQYVPRLFRIYPLYKEVTRTSGIITETAWAGAVFNLFLYMLASHVVGAAWYLFAIDRQHKCWHESCKGIGCSHLFSRCDVERGSYALNETFCALVDPDQIVDSDVFNFGIYYDVLRLKIVERHHFFKKLIYCFWWGLRSLRYTSDQSHNC
ncbi:hypothetical protein Cgig2_001191 [Carnegiea gigantea]|uniref:Ion transport domain-containing protein n=1 Tax=Carnegiea gigantea TaxID=171969 RepID=A0A9Q1JJE9_9CARY|nr:hypothetical protein Cgig2_001191 [Carnegiea gigantea]